MRPTDQPAAPDRSCLAFGADRSLLAVAAVFSSAVNILALTGPVFMLLVYDSVLPARSIESLTALALLMAAMFAGMALLDFARGRILARIGCRWQARAERPVMLAALAHAAAGRTGHGAAGDPSRDLDAIRQVFAAPVLPAIFDLPWVPLFLAGIFLFHPMLGWLAVAGGAVILTLTLGGRWLVARRSAPARRAEARSARQAGAMLTEAPELLAIGVQEGLMRRWQDDRGTALQGDAAATDLSGGLAAISRSFRLFLQSAMLAAAAALVLQDAMTAGGMFAASVLMGRALAPIDLAVSQWPMVQRALQARAALHLLLTARNAGAARTRLPRPKGHLQAEQLTVRPPGARHATLRLVSFDLRPGQALGVIGPSGSGKSSLANAAVGVWPTAGGALRLGGAEIGHYAAGDRAGLIGYLPQRVRLFAGSVAENIARMSNAPDETAVTDAARLAGAHEMILRLPDGYDTRVGDNGLGLSGGQIQRVGLARALYGDPVLLVLDEADAHLDHPGCTALSQAVRAATARGACVLLTAHRPAAIACCDLLLVLEQGTRSAFGPREAVLSESVRAPGALRLETAAAGP